MFRVTSLSLKKVSEWLTWVFGVLLDDLDIECLGLLLTPVL